MNNEQKMVREFHETFGHPVQDRPVPQISLKDKELRYTLISEELFELDEAMNNDDLVEVADAIGDLLYVVYGTAVVYGLDMEPIVAEIHRSNMTKVWPDGNVYYRDDGKVLKPETFEDPDIASIIKEQQG